MTYANLDCLCFLVAGLERYSTRHTLLPICSEHFSVARVWLILDGSFYRLWAVMLQDIGGIKFNIEIVVKYLSII